MARDLDSAPLADQPAFSVDDESRSLDASDLFTVHIFHLDDVEQRTEGFIGIGFSLISNGLTNR